MVALLTTPSSAMLFSNTEIILPTKMGYPQPKNHVYGYPVQDSLPAHRHSFLQEWQHKAEVAKQQVEATQQSSAKYYNQHAVPLTKIGIGSNVAIKTPAQNFGALMASSQLYHLTGNITLKPPVAEYSLETVASCVEMLQCPCQHV